MNNILLTGGSGFFGYYLKKELEKSGSVTTIGISDCDNICIDLSKDIPLLTQKYDLVVHAAGKAHIVPRNKKERQSFYDVNYSGTLNLLKSLSRKDLIPDMFVFISSVAVYGLESGENINEDAELKAEDPYGDSKIMAEKEVLKWGNENGVRVTILRLPLLIGKNAPGNLGAMISAIKKGRFAIIGKGVTRRSMVFAGDVAGFIPQIAETGGIYNLTDGYHPSYKELAKAIGNKLGKRSLLIIPDVLAVLMARFSDVLQIILRRELPFNSRRLKKLTSSLTFNDSIARAQGWNSNRVLDIVDEWV
ncbi:MAG: NAD-dependent epimerase/dehydratase family protein [Chlorobi bacterium]|nr:NAD-dependent epimerase/dehydratase family protein [Chlorobiota bacterium]